MKKYIVVVILLGLWNTTNAIDYGTTGTTGTGGIFIKHENVGINKPVFDMETINEIYKIEALMMVFIILYTFFMRVIGARAKKQKILGL